VALEEVGLLDYLAAGADEGVRRVLPAGAERLAAAGTLVTTLRAYADCDLNVMRTAEQLVVHPNTVHYRLRRAAELSGRDPRRFNDLVELLTALRLVADEA
jgi:DNA-binding PucR family transcriptional regulator